MLVSKIVKVKWDSKTKNHYESKGYVFTKMEDEFEVKVEDLNDGSSALVEVKCDYCGVIVKNRYKDYKKIMNKNIIGKNSCKNCKGLKQKEILEHKCKNGTILENDVGFYSLKENRMSLLKNYISENRCFNKLYDGGESEKIFRIFKNHNHDIVEAVNELGYNMADIFNRKPNHYYDDFKKLEKEINEVINTYGRFPTIEEIYNEMKIDWRRISKHGGINEIKKRMGYDNEYNLVDKRGFLNSSSYEYIVASFLIANDIPYKREQYPFPKNEGKYRSDFMFELENGEKIHCEVWGYSPNENVNYNKCKIKKKALYRKYNIRLVSIEKDIFYSNNLITIQKKMYKLFNKIFKLKFKELTYDDLFPKKINLTDEEILDEIMKYSDNEDYLPTVLTLKKNSSYYLYNEVLRRYGNYYNFADKFHRKIIRHTPSYWTENKIFEYFKELNDKDIMINRKNLSGYQGLNDKIVVLGGLIEWKLKYFATNNFKPIKKEIEWIRNVANNRGTNIKNKVTSSQQNQAKQILLDKKISIENNSNKAS